MERKLIKQGTSTLMISLPAKWVQHNSLLKGSAVHLSEDNNELLIRSTGERAPKEVNIEITGSTESLIRTLLTNSYRRGFDKIHIKFNTQEQFLLISSITKTRLIGFEITNKDSTSCTLENITEPDLDSFTQLFDKILLNISELFAELRLRYAGAKNIEVIEEIEERIQKYDNYCRRAVQKNASIPYQREFLWSFLTILIHAQRELYFTREMKPTSDATTKYLSDVESLFNALATGLRKKDIKIVQSIHDIEKEVVRQKGMQLLKKSSSDILVMHHLLASARLFYQANSPLIGLLFQA